MSGHVVPATSSSSRQSAIAANRWVYRLSRYWLPAFTIVFGLYVGLPFLAPVLMALGLELPARIIYTVYSYLCHQLPQRSYFLFGPQFTYSLAAIEAAGGNISDIAPLTWASVRQFIGTPAMGWKVAWSDRMVSMYTSMLVFAWLWYPLRRRIHPIRWQGLALLVLPMVIDGFSHLLSDFSGFGQGFRDTNTWLATLTSHTLPSTFYAGDAWGSFNSALRLVTGILFGLAIVWFCFPYLAHYFEDMQRQIQRKFQRAEHAL